MLKPKLTRAPEMMMTIGISLGVYEGTRTLVAHESNPALWVIAAALFVGGIVWHFRSPRKPRPVFPDSQSRLKL